MQNTLIKSMLLLFTLQLAQAPLELGASESCAPEEPLNVVCTLGILGELAKQIGGEFVSVEVLSSPQQDPHFVEPRPTLMRKARKADLFVEVGLQLELWADKVVSGSGNGRIQPGQAGHLVASTGISTLELPTSLSREWGDVHPNGNPHIWLDPINVKLMAGNLAKAMSGLDTAHASFFQANLESFERRIDEALFGHQLLEEFGSRKLVRLARSGKLIEYLKLRKAEGLLGGWLKRALPLRGKPLVTYHKTFIYFAQRFGMSIPIEVEGKPGIPPTPKHKAAVLKLMRDLKVGALLQSVFFDQAAGEYLCEHSSARMCVVPIDVGPGSAAKDIFGLIDLYLDELLLAYQQAGK